MKRIAAVALTLAALLATTAGALAATEIKLAHVVNEKDAFHACALKFKEIVEEKTGGEIVVQLFPNATLGDERNLLEGLKMGVIDSAIITGGPIINFMPQFGVFDLPFLFSSPEHAYKVLDGEIGRKMLADMEKNGWKGLAYGERGFRNLTNSKRPVVTPEDMKGLKIRLMQNPVFVDSFKALGANAVPMAWTEALTALQQGAIDGQENPLNVIVAFNLNESQKYLSMTRHAYSPNVILFSLVQWKKFSPEQQAIMEEAAQAAAKYNRELDNANEAQWLQELRDKGMEVVETPDLAAFRAAVQPIYEKYQDKFGKDLIEAIQNVQ